MANDSPLEIVIIGLGAGGLYASKNALNFNRNSRVTVIEKRDFDMFSPCGLPYVIEGEVASFEDIKHVVPTSGTRMTKLLSHEAVRVDHEHGIVTVMDLKTGEEKNIHYDSLILAMGTRPINLPVPGAREFEGRGVHFCSDPTDSQALLDAARTSGERYAVVVGGGAIGLEVAIALRRRGLGVAVIEILTHAFPRSLDPQMSQLVVEKLEAEGIRVLFGKGIDSVNGTDRVESVTIADEVIPCDIVVMGVGMRPDLTLPGMIGCKTDRGLVLTNSRMETSVKGVFAVGDLVRTFSRIDGSKTTMQLATSAYRQGITAGINAAGGNTAYPGALNTFVTKVGSQEIAATGLTLEGAKSAGFDAAAVQVKALIKPHFISDSTLLVLRAIVDRKDGRILGAQAIGEAGAASRINLFSMAIQTGMNLHDLYDTELAYNPPVSEMFDIVSQLAEIGLKRLRLPPRECRDE